MLVMNGYGMVTSQVATVTLVACSVTPPMQSVPVGSSATFHLEATVLGGDCPLGLQWYRNATNALADATNATLRVADLQPSDAGVTAWSSAPAARR